MLNYNYQINHGGNIYVEHSDRLLFPQGRKLLERQLKNTIKGKHREDCKDESELSGVNLFRGR